MKNFPHRIFLLFLFFLSSKSFLAQDVKVSAVLDSSKIRIGEQVRLDQLRAWDWAPENAALLSREGLEFALTTHGLADRKKFRQNLALAIQRGLTEKDALAGTSERAVFVIAGSGKIAFRKVYGLEEVPPFAEALEAMQKH